MCGMWGTSKEGSCPRHYRGLRKLEYRGYDSAGIAVAETARASRFGAPKAAQESRGSHPLRPLDGTYGIGHTRWPHTAAYRRERSPSSRLHRHDRCRSQRHCRNYLSLKKKLISEAISSPPRPIPKLSRTSSRSTISSRDGHRPSLEEAFARLQELTGVFALVVIATDDP